MKRIYCYATYILILCFTFVKMMLNFFELKYKYLYNIEKDDKKNPFTKYSTDQHYDKRKICLLLVVKLTDWSRLYHSRS